MPSWAAPCWYPKAPDAARRERDRSAARRQGSLQNVRLLQVKSGFQAHVKKMLVPGIIITITNQHQRKNMVN